MRPLSLSLSLIRLPLSHPSPLTPSRRCGCGDGARSCPLVRLPACLLACLPACLLACSPACNLPRTETDPWPPYPHLQDNPLSPLPAPGGRTHAQARAQTLVGACVGSSSFRARHAAAGAAGAANPLERGGRGPLRAAIGSLPPPRRPLAPLVPLVSLSSRARTLAAAPRLPPALHIVRATATATATTTSVNAASTEPAKALSGHSDENTPAGGPTTLPPPPAVAGVGRFWGGQEGRPVGTAADDVKSKDFIPQPTRTSASLPHPPV